MLSVHSHTLYVHRCVTYIVTWDVSVLCEQRTPDVRPCVSFYIKHKTNNFVHTRSGAPFLAECAGSKQRRHTRHFRVTSDDARLG